MKYVLDLHGYTVTEAKVAIDNMIKSISGPMNELVIVHGYSSNVLQTFVRKQYRNSKIKQKIITINQGETIFLL